jgi:ComF family protein
LRSGLPLNVLIDKLLLGVGDLLLPPSCPVCRQLLETSHAIICPECLAGLESLTPPICQLCGHPQLSPHHCPYCHGRHLEDGCDSISALYSFEGSAQEALFKLKFNHKSILAKFFAKQIMTEKKDWLEDRQIDLLVPVPLHPSKLAGRGYNQAALIAKYLSKMVKIKTNFFDLVRCQKTLSQSKMLSDKARWDNVKDAFEVRKKNPFVKKRICLIDDVATTGATLHACSRALKKAGAEDVVAVCVARTLGFE